VPVSISRLAILLSCFLRKSLHNRASRKSGAKTGLSPSLAAFSLRFQHIPRPQGGRSLRRSKGHLSVTRDQQDIGHHSVGPAIEEKQMLRKLGRSR
jgi:hypothetical protein